MADLLRVDVTGLRPLLNRLALTRQGLGPAASRAINRALASGASLLRRGVAKDTGVQAAKLKGRIRVRAATVAKPVGVLAVGPEKRPLRLIHFRRWLTVRRTKYGRGVALKGQGAQFVDVPARAFVAKQRQGGSDAVFARDGKARLPITQLVGPLLADYVAGTGWESQARARVRDRLQVEFEREVRFRVLGRHAA